MSEPSTVHSPELRALLDRDAIRDLVRRYAHLIWQNRPLDTVTLFARNGVMDMGSDGGAITGHEALRAIYSQKVGDMTLHPFVHNHVIDLLGDEASGFAYLDLRCVRDGQSLIGSGYYQDRYVREDGGWKFSYRKLNMHYLVKPGEDWHYSSEKLQ
jgi:hypothetical protein